MEKEKEKPRDIQKTWGKLKFIEGPNRGRYPFCHSLFWDGEIKLVVDPVGSDEMRKISNDCKVEVILLSHYHEDHIGGLHLFPEAKIYMHGLDAPPIADEKIFLDYYGMEPDSEDAKWLLKAFKELFHFQPRPTDVELTDGQVLDFGDLHVEVIHTPGHSPGHTCFYFKEPDVMFLADYDLTKFGPWYGDRVSDIDALVESSKKVRFHPAGWKVVAHEDGVLEGDLEDKWEIYMGVIDRREANLLDFLVEPRTMDDIVKRRIVYGKAKKPESFYNFGERGIMTRHIERLLGNGVIRKEGDRYLRSA